MSSWLRKLENLVYKKLIFLGSFSPCVLSLKEVVLGLIVIEGFNLFKISKSFAWLCNLYVVFKLEKTFLDFLAAILFN